jgi:methionyl-tRNA formyltransferase
MKKYIIAIAGSTSRTTLCAETLKSDSRFEISWILTPRPKPVGRKKTVSPNPLDIFAKENKIPVIYVETKIDELVKNQILASSTNVKTNVANTQETTPNIPQPDFLLVVDFGYFIPTWLLKLPKIAPLNIHPSELPKWRGSSPGQFSILFNDKKSAVTLMMINNKFDQGPIIHQDFFDVDANWTQTDYYSHAFELMCNNLGEKIAKFAKSFDDAKPQPEKSPTITARMLKKDDAFVAWEVIKTAINGDKLQNESRTTGSSDSKSDSLPQLSKLLLTALEHNQSLSLTLERASKAFNPWPGLWTKIPTIKGEKRMKLLELELEEKKLVLKTVHVEGKTPTSWSEIKNSILE